MHLRLLAALIVASSALFAASIAGPGESVVLGHAQLVSSDPGAGSVVATAATELRLVFSEPLEAAASSADVLDGVGRLLVSQGGATDPSDAHTLVVPLPPLTDGAYQVQWRSLSAADGHSAQGFLTFAVGAGTVLPDTRNGGQSSGDVHAGHSGGEATLETLGRLLGSLGAMLAFGLWILALGVIRPVMPTLVGPLPLAAVASALAGAAGAAILSLSAAGHAGLPLPVYLTDSRSGQLILARIAVLAIAAMLGFLLAKRRPSAALAVAGIGGALGIVLLAWSGHASAFSSPAPVVVMIVHIGSAAIWTAGLASLGVLALRRLPVRGLVPRFSALALVCAGLFGLTGIVFADLQAGGLVGLGDPYQATLTTKIGLVTAALVIGAWNYLGRGSADPMRDRIGPQRPVALEPTCVTAAAGIGLGLQPARPGPDRFVATVPSIGGQPPAAVELQLQRVDRTLGTSRIEMQPTPGDPASWRVDGGLLLADSSWSATVVLRDATGTERARQRFQLAMGATSLGAGRATAALSIPAIVGVALLALALLGLTYVAGGGTLPRTDPRTGRAALLIGAAVAGPVGALMLLAWSIT